MRLLIRVGRAQADNVTAGVRRLLALSVMPSNCAEFSLGMHETALWGAASLVDAGAKTSSLLEMPSGDLATIFHVFANSAEAIGHPLSFSQAAPSRDTAHDEGLSVSNAQSLCA